MSQASEPWYKSAFQADYLERYAHRDEEEAQLIFDLVVRHAPLSKQERYLDLCCGAGRHSQVFCEKGFQIVGLDLSEDLLRAASCIPCGGSTFVRADMRFHPFLQGSFDGVLHLFTAFGYFYEDQENEEVFRQVAQILKPGGWYLFDYLNSEQVLKHVFPTATVMLEEHETLGRLKTEKHLSENGRRVIKRVKFLDSPQPREFLEDVALYNDAELRQMLNRSGFDIVRVFGSYEGEAHKGDSSRWIAFCQKR